MSDRYEEKFRRSVAREYASGGETAVQLAERHRIAKSTIYRWVEEFEEKGSLPSKEPAEVRVLPVKIPGSGWSPTALGEGYLEARIGELELRFVGQEPARVVEILERLGGC